VISARRALAFVIACVGAGLAACSGDIRFNDPDDADGGASASSDGDAGVEAEAASVDPGINCGDGGVCAPGSEFCCASASGFACLATGQACSGIPIICDDSFVCPAGRVCCAEAFGTVVHDVECKLPERCSGFALCDPYNPQCPAGQTCQGASLEGLPPGYSTCL
jgi:hypothetical protein